MCFIVFAVSPNIMKHGNNKIYKFHQFMKIMEFTKTRFCFLNLGFWNETCFFIGSRIFWYIYISNIIEIHENTFCHEPRSIETGH